MGPTELFHAISSGVKNVELVMSIGEKNCSKIAVLVDFFFGGGGTSSQDGKQFFLQFFPLNLVLTD